MHCSCRTDALRMFLRSVAEVQLPASRARSLARSPPTLSHLRPTNVLRFGLFLPATATLPHRQLCRQFGTAQGESGTVVGDEAARAEAAPAHEDATPEKDRPPKQGKRKPKTKRRQDRGPSPPEQPEPHMPGPQREPWQVQKAALKEKFPEGWSPRKRLSPDALAGIRALHQQLPDEYTTEVLAKKFEVSAEAIRRILKGKWAPSPEEEIKRQERWFNRGKQVWDRWAALGKKPPTKWRREGVVRDPSFHEKKKEGMERRRRASVQKKLAESLL